MVYHFIVYISSFLYHKLFIESINYVMLWNVDSTKPVHNNGVGVCKCEGMFCVV